MAADFSNRVSKFSGKYKARVSRSNQREYRTQTRIWKPYEQVSFSKEEFDNATIDIVDVYDISISEPKFAEILTKLEEIEHTEQMIKNYASVKAAWDQFQLTLQLCQPYHTV